MSDTGERFVTEWLSGVLWERQCPRWAIVDRNTGELLRKMKDNQPHAKGTVIWRGDKEQAQWWCDRLNDCRKPQHADPGTGPDSPARSVDIGVLMGQARRDRARAVAPPAVFSHCDVCKKYHRSGACPS